MDIDDHILKLAALENEVQSHHEELASMRKRMHDLANAVAALTGTFNRIEKMNDETLRRFEKHMDNEEHSFATMNEKLHSMEKSSAKIVGIATGAFIAAQVVMKVGLGL